MINQHNSILHDYFVPNWPEMCGVVDVLTVLLLSPTRKFREIIKMWCQELYIYIYIYNDLSIIDMDFLYQFNLKLTWNFQKLTGPWLVGVVVNRVGIYGSKVAEGLLAFQRRSCYLFGVCQSILQTMNSFKIDLWPFWTPLDMDTLRPFQNGRHCAEDNFKYFSFNYNVSILIKVLLNYAPKGPIDTWN